jgi:hypothetical protein
MEHNLQVAEWAAVTHQKKAFMPEKYTKKM